MHQEPRAVAMPSGAGSACSSAGEPRFADGDAVPVLADGYVETEYLLSGSARTYSGPATGPVAIATEANPYATLVRHPADAAEFSGRVVVEPFNTSFGQDRDALWARVGDLLQAEGDAWVDGYGNPLGGVRSPQLDVPLARYEAHSEPGPMCQLVGREMPLPAGTLVARYRDAGRYLCEFTAALDEAIRARLILAADREPILQNAADRAREVFAVNDYPEVLTQ